MRTLVRVAAGRSLSGSVAGFPTGVKANSMALPPGEKSAHRAPAGQR
jgi:hypothetical protein